MQSIARLKNSNHPPRKMRLLADLIRGKEVEEALDILRHHPKIAYARELEKLVLSAIANWEQKYEDADPAEAGLFIKTIFVDGGKVLKRIQPAPQGRAHRIRKRSNHVTLVLESANLSANNEDTEEVVEEQNEENN